MENTKSAQRRLLHWSKDFVTHVRTVHFMLIVVATILIVTATNTEDRDRNIASGQIKQIAQFEQDWSPSKLYKQAMDDDQIKTNWTEQLTLEIPDKTHVLRYLGVKVDVSNDLMMSLEPWKLNSRVGSPEFVQPPSHLQTLGDFSRFWDELNRGAKLILVKPPDATSRCDARIFPHSSSGDKGYLTCRKTIHRGADG